jgi:hypothetical protein
MLRSPGNPPAKQSQNLRTLISLCSTFERHISEAKRWKLSWL